MKIVPYLLFLLPLVSSGCSLSTPSSTQHSASAPTSVTKVTQRKAVAFQERKEIIEWEKTLELETPRIVDSGHDKLEEVIQLVSENTQAAEQSARTAYIEQHLEFIKFGTQLALEAARQQLDPESKELHQDYAEQIDEIMEDNYREVYDNDFNKRKIQLIEKYFQKTNASQKNI